MSDGSMQGDSGGIAGYALPSGRRSLLQDTSELHDTIPRLKPPRLHAARTTTGCQGDDAGSQSGEGSAVTAHTDESKSAATSFAVMTSGTLDSSTSPESNCCRTRSIRAATVCFGMATASVGPGRVQPRKQRRSREDEPSPQALMRDPASSGVFVDCLPVHTKEGSDLVRR
jgi:hypothetical protein